MKWRSCLGSCVIDVACEVSSGSDFMARRMPTAG